MNEELTAEYLAAVLEGDWNDRFLTGTAVTRAKLHDLEVPLLATPEQALFVEAYSTIAEVAERAGTIALQTHQQIAGVVENMSGFVCPGCGEPVRPYDNVPVLSWLVLRAHGVFHPVLITLTAVPMAIGPADPPIAEATASSRAARLACGRGRVVVMVGFSWLGIAVAASMLLGRSRNRVGSRSM